jgi:hypothetical protein
MATKQPIPRVRAVYQKQNEMARYKTVFTVIEGGSVGVLERRS